MLELALLQAEYSALGLMRFFIGFVLIMTLYIGALLFTYWISKDE